MITTLRKIELYPDGVCKTCLDSYALCEHRERERVIDRNRMENIRLVNSAQRSRRIHSIMLRHELESDERGTAYDKAAAMLKR